MIGLCLGGGQLALGIVATLLGVATLWFLKMGRRHHSSSAPPCCVDDLFQQGLGGPRRTTAACRLIAIPGTVSGAIVRAQTQR
ncbi:hypothetical protein [Bradyrhizobium rifense]|uniref:hypothetical protein n=1 Tax=Bradyrhizobium rifense TaxID=515499 RepID=UPI0032214C73